MLGYDPDRVEVLIYQLVHLDAGRRADEDVEAPRRRRLPRGVRRRDRRRRRALVSRQPRPRPDDRDRRRPRGRAVAEEPRLLRAVRACAHRRDPAQRGRRRDVADAAGAARPGRARAREAAARAARGRGGSRREARAAGDPDVRDPRRRRLSPLLPRASRARERAAGVPPCALPGDTARDRALPRPRRGRRAGADVRDPARERRARPPIATSRWSSSA